MPILKYSVSEPGQEVIAFEDASLDLNLVGMSVDDILAALEITDGTAFRDAVMSLLAATQDRQDVALLLGASNQGRNDAALSMLLAAMGLRDARVEFSVWGASREALALLFTLAKLARSSAHLSLVVDRGLKFADAGLELWLGDGRGSNDAAMALMAIKPVPAFKSVVAQRVSSVAMEV